MNFAPLYPYSDPSIVYVIAAVNTGLTFRLATEAAAFACGVLLAYTALGHDAAPLTGVVTAVLEGDAIRLQLPSGPTVARLANIDAPEPRQPGGMEARKALHERIIGEEVSLDVAARDAEGWLDAVIYLRGENINGWMVKQGHAWAWRQQTSDPSYCIWENAARSLHRGLWAREEWLAPWEWRQGGKGKAIRYTDYRKADVASCFAEMKRKT